MAREFGRIVGEANRMSPDGQTLIVTGGGPGLMEAANRGASDVKAKPRVLLRVFIGTRYLIDRQPPTLQQAVASDFMSQGHFAAHIRRIRQLYREQRDALAETLTRRAAGKLDVALPDQGMHLVAYLRDGSSDVEVETAAQRAGIVVHAISRFYRAAHPRPGLLIGFSGFPRQLIVPAAARLATLVVKRSRN